MSDKISKKVLSEEEYHLYLEMSDIRKKEFLAGRFAIKEALYKAGLKQKFSLLNIKYHSDDSIYLQDYPNIKISISHEQEYAIGYAIIEY